MHDWTLLSVLLEWSAGQATLSFKSPEGDEILVTRSVVDLRVAQFNEWGPSASVKKYAVRTRFSSGSALGISLADERQCRTQLARCAQMDRRFD